jgi:hypothetical protein
MHMLELDPVEPEVLLEQAQVEDVTNIFLSKASPSSSYPYSLIEFSFNHYFMLSQIVH